MLLKNLKKESKKNNLNFLSIIYNSLIKYPILGFQPTHFFMYRLYENSYKKYHSYYTFFKIIKMNKIKCIQVFLKSSPSYQYDILLNIILVISALHKKIDKIFKMTLLYQAKYGVLVI